DRTGTELESMRVHTERRMGESFYRTQVELRIISNMGFDREYYTEFNLPSGVYISDHYLMIDGRREAGIFSEKRSALWVYHRITEGRRDPGLLYYTAPGRPALHVFPVHTTAPRVTGFELIHRGPFTLQIDQHSAHIESPVLEMDAATVGPLRIFTNQEWSDLRERLKRTQPRQLHIALDCSLNARESEVVEQYTNVLQSIDALRNTDQSMRISCVDHASRTIIIKGRTTTNDIRKALSDLRPESAAGGFFLGRLIARDLFTLVREPENVTAPVYLIVAPSSTRAHFIEDLRQFQQVNAIELPAYVLHLQPVRSNGTTSESTQPDARQRENTRSTTDTRAPTDTQQPMDTEQHRENRTIDSTTKVLPLNLLNDAVQTTDTALVAAARNQRLRPITLNDLITRLQSESAEKNSEFQQSKSDAATG
ncbi:MAG: MSEP-CTERM sorting domain-containing protein, partial [Leptospiraceae bacterium]|nr:MSEP-CTERM sorting domain-containing protein [Leptospiraceae bacterium]